MRGCDQNQHREEWHRGYYTEEVLFPGARPGQGLLAAALATLLVVGCLYATYFAGLNRVGLLGPDEPRYAAIGREMAESGDWITPRLWGEPWFEKPPLLYWMTALAFRAGLDQDAAPRFLVAVLSTSFLALYWHVLRRRAGTRVAWLATMVLATSAGWVAFGQIGATDMPLAVTLGAGMLLAFEGLETRSATALRWAGVAFGAAVLAKGLVGLALALPLVWYGWRRWREFRIPVLLGLAVAAPWYLSMTWRHGAVFLSDFFGKHHLARFGDAAIAHVQPWWFYVPVVLGGIFPWTPLLVLVRRSTLMSRFGGFLGLWFGFGFLFFSAVTNKLPGYALPLLPALCGLLGMALNETKRAHLLLGVCVLLLSAVSAIAGVLPQALVDGLSRAVWGDVPLEYVAALFLAAAAVAWLDLRGRRVAAVAIMGSLTALAVLYLKLSIYPVLDRMVSARGLWRSHSGTIAGSCVEGLSRDDRYGLNYYTRTPLPDCPADRPGVKREPPPAR
jgi:4-amino-4-deoxy-L-arabinose transferase-like glycosyltransferase